MNLRYLHVNVRNITLVFSSGDGGLVRDQSFHYVGISRLCSAQFDICRQHFVGYVHQRLSADQRLTRRQQWRYPVRTVVSSHSWPSQSYTRRMRNTDPARSHLYRDQLFISVDSRQHCCVTTCWAGAALCISGRRLLDTNPRLTVTDAERSEFGLDEIIRNHELFDYVIREETAALRQNRIAEWPSGKLTAHASSSSTRPVTSEAPRWHHLLFRKTGTLQPFKADRWEIRNRLIRIEIKRKRGLTYHTELKRF